MINKRETQLSIKKMYKIKRITKEVTKNFLVSSGFLNSDVKEIVVTSIGFSQNFDLFLNEFISTLKKKDFRLLVVFGEFCGENNLSFKMSHTDSDFAQDENLISIQTTENGIDIPESVKKSYDLILYVFFENIFAKWPEMFNSKKYALVYVNKKRANSSELIQIRDVIAKQSVIHSAYVAGKS